MFVDKAGELIADVMTMNRSLATIPSASAILDTSNYTFQAISYGKDAAGFQYHAHKILSPSSDGVIKVISYGSNSFSGYQSSSTASALEFEYRLLPQSINPTDTRLELKSTVPVYSSGVIDAGQYLNVAKHPTLSAFSHLIGGFTPASGSNFKVYNQSSSLIFSGSIQSFYNSHNMMDFSGFLKFSTYSADIQKQIYQGTQIDYPNITWIQYYSAGVYRACGSNFPSEVDLFWLLTLGDAASLNLFGGIYQIGLWCLDIKEMLKDGYYPPYNFNTLNTNRKYRLFAKKTFNKDLLYYASNSAFKSLFMDGGFSNSNGIVLKWKIRFV
jgi:hypothetical protein